MAETLTATDAVVSTRPPFWRDIRVLRIVAQIVAVIVAIVTIRWLLGNLTRNLDEQGIPTGFDFLDNSAGFAVRDSPFDPASPIRHLIWVGVRNTAAISVVGIAIALILGTLIGIGRLSTNWIVRKLSTFYVETFRNIPVLVIIIFFGFALFTFGPLPLFNPANPPQLVKIPGHGQQPDDPVQQSARLPLLPEQRQRRHVLDHHGVGAGCGDRRVDLANPVNERTGAPHHRVMFSFGTLLVVGLSAYFALRGPVSVSWPVVSESGRIIVGGIATNDGYIAITLALGVYTASHIAEIIRGSILAVPKGQVEAGNALALSSFQRYRFVILPQAARIALPPIINQFLNLIKNSSLATAVAFPEITSLVRTAIGNGNPAPQFILILMGCYLAFSLFISLVLNIVNRKLRIEGRS